MNQRIIQNLQTLSLLVVVWLCAACTSTAAPEAAAPSRTSCTADSSAGSSERFAGCEGIVGDLRIENTKLTDLGHLARLRSVSGTLFISGNSALTSLRGLEQLRAAKGIVIVNNPKLADVASLNELSRVERVSVAHNPELTELAGMNRVQRLETLMVMKNGVTRVTGFNGLESAGRVTISKNAHLIYLSGFERLSVVEDLALEGNPRLAPKANMLPSLVYVDGELSVAGSHAINPSDLLDTEVGGRVETASR